MNTFLPGLILALTPAHQEAEEPGGMSNGSDVRLEAAAWVVSPSGWLSITRGSKAGTATTMSVGDEFGLDLSVEPLIKAEVSVTGPHALGARFWTLSLSGTSVDDDAFVYHGFTFDAGRRVRTEVDLTLLDVGYHYAFNPGDAFQVTGVLGAEYWRFRSRLRTIDALPPIDTSRGFDSAFWMAGIEAGWTVSKDILVSGFLAGSTERQDQFFFEGQADLHLRLWDHASLEIAYRVHTLHFRQSTNRSGLNFHGPLLGIEIYF